MDRAADLWTLVSNLKNAAYDEQVHILQMLGDKLINDCRIEVFGVTIEPLWVEAYCYDETHFPDYNTHRSRKQKNRFGQMYFHERGYGGVDICLSNSEDFCLSFLLKATLANGHFLTQTQLPRELLSTGKTPGKARSTAHACVFGAAPNAVAAPEKIFETVANCACVSIPITTSH